MRRVLSFVVPLAAAAAAHLATAQVRAPVVSVGAVNIANVPPPPLPPGLSGLRQGVLKGVAALSPARKLELVRAQGILVPGEQNLDAPVRLSNRTPYAGDHAYLAAYGWHVADPHFDPPETMFKSDDSTSFLNVVFRAEPDRMYLVDCVVDGGSFRVRTTTTKTGGGSLTDNTATTQAPDHHVTSVIQKDAQPRRVDVRIHVSGGSWGFVGACDITPIKP